MEHVRWLERGKTMKTFENKEEANDVTVLCAGFLVPIKSPAAESRTSQESVTPKLVSLNYKYEIKKNMCTHIFKKFESQI